MNKKFLVCLMAMVALASTDVFASRARVVTMGTGDGGLILGGNGDRGSFSYDDGYNIFHNPAEVNQFNNWGIIEKSNDVHFTTSKFSDGTSMELVSPFF